MKSVYDVIVVGGGGSGLAAAVSAAEGGLEVIVLEKLSVLGGTTGLAVGSLTANRTSLQRDAGIADSLDDHLEDVGLFAAPEIESRNAKALRRYFLSETAETYEWLVGMGLAFHGPSPEPPNRVSRMHNVVPNARAYVAVLQSRLVKLGGTILCSATVTDITREENRVAAVEVELDGASTVFRASRGVVLAAGDYANSKSLITAHKGSQFAEIDGINPHAKGDGHRLVEKLGGELVNMDITWGPELRFVPPKKKPFVQLLPTRGPLAKATGWLLPWVPRWFIQALIKRMLVTWQHPDGALLKAGAIMVNASGERFCNELATPEREISVAVQPGKFTYLLLDERLINRFSKWPHFISTAPEIAYAYVEDYMRLRPDIAIAGTSLEAVAGKRNMAGEKLAETVAAYNTSVASGSPDRYGRSGGRELLQGEKWVLLGPAKAYFTITEGGARIDETLQVLDPRGAPLAGLYAVGCNGLGGQILFGHGLHIAWAITSGRLVGKVLCRTENH